MMEATVRHGELTGFAERLDGTRKLCTIAAEVDPSLEVAEINRRVAGPDGEGPALLFRQVAGSPFPLAVNLFGTDRRLALALGLPDLSALEGIGRRLAADEHALAPFAPRPVEEPPWREVREEPDLGRLPFIRNWEGDGGPTVDGYITLPVVISRDPASGEQNCGIYRASRQGRDRLGLAWRASSGAARHAAAWHGRGEPMPVAVVLGGPPALIYAATVPLPEGMDEMAFAGFLAGAPLEVVRTAEGLLVPAGADMVLEGYVSPGDTGDEGRFGNHTGRYTDVGLVPVMTVTRISRCRQPLVPATVTGPPPTENRCFARATERLMLPFLQRVVPALTDCAILPGGEYHGAAVVATGEGADDCMELARALRRTSWLAGSRLLLFVDAGQDCRDHGRLFWRLLNRTGWPNVAAVLEGSGGEGDCLVLDARRTPAEADAEVRRPGSITELVGRRWQEYGCPPEDTQ
jgi:4-hydroxy-3-polyprenylbenzoate decarboxylase